jgi:hypothetical protein
MRSLFLKIFLWYWLANILVFGVLTAVFMWAELARISHHVDRQRPPSVRQKR